MDTITLTATVEEARTLEPLTVKVTDTRHPLEIDLAHFIGTQEWHRWSVLFTRHLLTDGTLHLAEEAGAFWLMDLIASHFTKRKVRAEQFQVWTLTRFNRDTHKNDAIVKAEDGNGNHVTQQLIPYTDFPLDTIKLYVAWSENNWVIMLPSEY